MTLRNMDRDHLSVQAANLKIPQLLKYGVGLGRSLIIILALEDYYARLNQGSRREVFALDSFEGFPQPSTLESWHLSGTKKSKFDLV